MSARLRFVAFAAALLAATSCTSGRPGELRPPSPTPTVSSAPSPSPSAPVSFDTARAMAHLRRLVVTIGIREAGSGGYRSAANYAAVTFERLGYAVTRQTVPLPAGRSQGVAVQAGSTQNVIATPPGFVPSKPHLVVGAHLDTVAVTRGANDNGSGSAILLELARLARVRPTALPIVWIAFGGEERRNPGIPGATYGSRYYLDHLPSAERRGIRGMLAIDMVGAGPKAYVCHAALTSDSFVDQMVATGKRLKLPVQKRVVAGYFSDHSPFEHAGFTVAWLWSGEHSTLHTPRDVMAVVQEASIERVGSIAWETLRVVRL